MLRERKMLEGRMKAGWYWFARWICRIFCVLFFRFRVYGKENIPDKGAFLLVSNHQSFFDPMFCGVALKRHLHFLARDSLFANRFFSWLISSLNAIPLKIGKRDVSAMKTVIRRLKEGKGVCVFPEGTRTSDGGIAPLKPGYGLLARRGEAPIVPVVIDGAFECWPRHKKIFSPGWISICYGKAIPAEELKGLSDRKLAEVLTDRLRQMQTKSRIRYGRKPYNY